MAAYIVKGDFLYSEDKDTLKEVKDGYLVVVDGKVAFLGREVPSAYRSLEIKDYSSHLIIPGMSDLHLHASQYQFRGLYMDMELLDWLNVHTFPEESKYREKEYAEAAYSIFIEDLRSSTTTRISAFATIHSDTTLLLMDKLEKAGIAGFVGKVNMDRNSPDILREKTEESIESTLNWLEQSKKFKSIKPIITPRFIPSCTDSLMVELGRIAKEQNLPLQSHLSENLSEIEWVKELCPASKCYADAYKNFDMWGTTPTIMAHCVWSDTMDEGYMFDKNIYIAHCPDSNMNLYSGIANVKYFLNRGAKIGLGSDVSGGESLSLVHSMIDAIKASKLRYRLVDDKDGMLNFKEAFFLATKGGGSFFGKVGSFEEGYAADFVVLDEKGLDTTLFKELSIEDRAERYCYLSGERKVLHKAVNGNLLF